MRSLSLRRAVMLLLLPFLLLLLPLLLLLLDLRGCGRAMGRTTRAATPAAPAPPFAAASLLLLRLPDGVGLLCNPAEPRSPAAAARKGRLHRSGLAAVAAIVASVVDIRLEVPLPFATAAVLALSSVSIPPEESDTSSCCCSCCRRCAFAIKSLPGVPPLHPAAAQQLQPWSLLLLLSGITRSHIKLQPSQCIREGRPTKSLSVITAAAAAAVAAVPMSAASKVSSSPEGVSDS